MYEQGLDPVESVHLIEEELAWWDKSDLITWDLDKVSFKVIMYCPRSVIRARIEVTGDTQSRYKKILEAQGCISSPYTLEHLFGASWDRRDGITLLHSDRSPLFLRAEPERKKKFLRKVEAGLLQNKVFNITEVDYESLCP